MRIEDNESEIDFSGHSVMLVLLAHQDDEFGLVPLITRAIASKVRVIVACLTSGYLSEQENSIRDIESRGSLQSLGIPPTDYWAIGTAERFYDSKLVLNLSRALVAIIAKINTHSLKVTMLVTHEIEGGHQDHDACNLVARKLFNVIEPSCKLALSFPMYHGEGTTFAFYKAFSPIKSSHVCKALRLSLSEKIKLLSIPFRYPSQWVSLLGLYPFAFYQFGVVGRLFLCRLQCNGNIDRPHCGLLLYERRNRFAFAEFEKLAAQFLSSPIVNHR